MTARDLRRFPRIRSEHPIRVRQLGPREVEEFGQTRVIGLGGCSFTSRRRFPVGSLVELQIPLQGGMLTADGRVVYLLEQADGGPEIGVEFLRVPHRHLARLRAVLGQEP